MILLAMVAFGGVAVPVTPDYAYSALAELSFETVVLWGFILFHLFRRGGR